MLNSKLSKWIACIGLTLFGAPAAWATCTPNPPVVATANGFTLTVDSTKNVGDLLGQASLVVPVTANAQCSGMLYLGVWSSPLPIVTVNGVNYYDIGIPGVGMIMRNMSFGRNLPFTWPWNDGNSGALLSNETYQFSFYKIGAITSAGSFTGLVAQRGFSSYTYTGSGVKDPNVYYVENIAIGVPIVIVPKLPSCTVTTPNIPVKIDSATAKSFAGIGSVVGSQDFNVDINCAGGDPGIQTGVYMTLTDATTPGNRSDTLTLATGSTASGVGIKVFQQGSTTPISFGADSKVVGNLNQFKVTNVGNQAQTIPFTAKYVKNSANMGAGLVKAVATFTMAYN